MRRVFSWRQLQHRVVFPRRQFFTDSHSVGIFSSPMAITTVPPLRQPGLKKSVSFTFVSVKNLLFLLHSATARAQEESWMEKGKDRVGSLPIGNQVR